jgi:hypothetical protein
MIIDVHVHPFCREATVTPSLEEGVKRMFGRHEPKAREMIHAALTRTSTWTFPPTRTSTITCRGMPM